jgi:hypothetical protein
MSFLTILTLIFIVLKLTNYIDWSWWFVVSPSVLFVVLWLGYMIWWESKTPAEKYLHTMKKRGLK